MEDQEYVTSAAGAGHSELNSVISNLRDKVSFCFYFFKFYIGFNRPAILLTDVHFQTLRRCPACINCGINCCRRPRSHYSAGHVLLCKN